MDVIYAAEVPSIAKLLSDHTKCRVLPDEIEVTENPDETGSFCIGWQFETYVLSPDGRIQRVSLELPIQAQNSAASSRENAPGSVTATKHQPVSAPHRCAS
jgi:hypothetical protein